MNQLTDLSGMIVLVHPHLSNDPAGRKNQIGIIASAGLEHDNILVSFNDNEHDLFSAHALLVLRDVDDIEIDATNDFSLLPYEDYADIIQVMILANSPHKALQKAAVELSRSNPIAMEYTMLSLKHAIALKMDQGYRR